MADAFPGVSFALILLSGFCGCGAAVTWLEILSDVTGIQFGDKKYWALCMRLSNPARLWSFTRRMARKHWRKHPSSRAPFWLMLFFALQFGLFMAGAALLFR